jgi:xylulokinase
MLRAGIPIDTVRILGGATKSSTWNQIQSDVYNRPVETLKMTDAALLGSAIFAAVGIKEFSDIPQGTERMVKVDALYTPHAGHAALYDEMYELYCGAYEALDEKGIFRALAKLQSHT